MINNKIDINELDKYKNNINYKLSKEEKPSEEKYLKKN